MKKKEILTCREGNFFLKWKRCLPQGIGGSGTLRLEKYKHSENVLPVVISFCWDTVFVANLLKCRVS